MEFASELEASLREFISGGLVELRESGRAVPASRLSWEVRGQGEKPLLHLWSECYNLTRRVLAITDHSDQHLTLAVERFGYSKPDRLEFIRTDFERSSRELARNEYCQRLKHILAARFPDESIESITASSDLEHSLSGSYARGITKRGSSPFTAFLAVPLGQSSDACQSALTASLLWLDRCRQSNRRGAVATLRIIVPQKMSATLAHRFAALDPDLPIELYEHEPVRDTLEKIDPRSIVNSSAWLVPRREAQALLDQSAAALDPIVALAPQAITLHPVSQSREIILRFRGLPFARWDDGRIFFGCSDAQQELTETSRKSLKNVLRELEIYRHPLATDTRHTLYRSHAERWLETLVREDVTRIDAALDPRFVYAQVFANFGGDHGILDLLTITRTGRLAILELKTTEHLHLPLQAADYWLHIRHHLREGNFSRYGYFPGVTVQDAPPLVYLVAPALRFHPALDVLQRYLNSDLEMLRVGLAESWRRGLRVVMRQ